MNPAKVNTLSDASRDCFEPSIDTKILDSLFIINDKNIDYKSNLESQYCDKLSKLNSFYTCEKSKMPKIGIRENDNVKITGTENTAPVWNSMNNDFKISNHSESQRKVLRNL